MVMPPAPTVPAWCEWQRGRSHVLIIAPHGGRRRRPNRLADGRAPKVNDLYTAEIARNLAQRLDASYIVNTALDRNELDLNRLAQVLRLAPWFLRLLEQELAAILVRHAAAEVLFVHGWNTTQARCDIGIGATLTDEQAARTHGAALTVAPWYVIERLGALRMMCDAAHLDTTYGVRYPARHPNNLLQLFRRQPRHTADGAMTRLASWAAADRVHAVQLELGVPLRWPGAICDRFLTAATRAFSSPPIRPAGAADGPARAESPATSAQPPPAPRALQFHDAAAGLGFVAGVAPRAEGSLGARLLLLLGERRVALFTGEEHGRATVVGGPVFEACSNGFTVRFDGPLLRLDDARLYLDLETALAASELCSTSVALTFTPGAVPAYGRISGSVRLGGETFIVDTFGFADPRLARRRVGTQVRQATLSAAFGRQGAVVARFGDDSGTGTFTQIRTNGTKTSPLGATTIHFDGDPLGPDRFVLSAANCPLLVARVATRMSIVQPAPRGGYARITFGIARFAFGETDSGSGFYEYARLMRRSGAPG